MTRRQFLRRSAQVAVAGAIIHRSSPSNGGPEAMAAARKKRPLPATGPLTVHPTNPRYFTDGSGKAVYLTGLQYWDILRHDGSSAPDALKFPRFLDIVQQFNGNFVRHWQWNELIKFQYKDREPFSTSPSPWPRLGPGTALDGRPKFDLSQFDQAYFSRLRSRVEAAGSRGIYVSIMLFEGHALQFSRPPWRWDGHPFHRRNNINGIDGDPNRDGLGLEVHTLDVPAVTAVQEAYVRHVIDTVNDLDNVLYEIANESGPYSTEWQYHLIRDIKTYEARKPKQHPVGMSFQYQGGSNRALFASPADWIAPGPEGGYADDPPAADGSKVILSDTDHFMPGKGDQAWVWKSFLRGLNPILYVGLKELRQGKLRAARRAMGHTRTFANTVDLAAMAPRTDVASTGYCLVAPGKAYVVYLPAGGVVRVDLSAASGVLAVEWFHPIRGQTVRAGIVRGGASRDFIAPFGGEAVLYVAAPH